MAKNSLDIVLEEVKRCQICVDFLPYAPKPILSIDAQTKILIIGQAPGQKVHDAGLPWQDKSGESLRDWLGLTQEQFEDKTLLGTMPMGFCFPGNNPKGSGDLPPRKECAPQWHKRILNEMPNIKLTLLIGQYAIKEYLGQSMKRNLTETVRGFEEYLPMYFPLVHPSPLNFRWQAKNPWFKKEVIPRLQQIVSETKQKQ